MYIYVLGCWNENILVTDEAVRGRIYRSLVSEEQVEWVRVESTKDVHIRPWLLMAIESLIDF